MHPLETDLRKNDGSIGDFAECNRNIIFLTEEDKVNLIIGGPQNWKDLQTLCITCVPFIDNSTTLIGSFRQWYRINWSTSMVIVRGRYYI